MRAEDARLEAEALTLKEEGLSFRRIAAVQGCSVSTAHDRVERALDHLVPIDTAERLRKVENERLEAYTLRAHVILERAEQGVECPHCEGHAVAPDDDRAMNALKRLEALSEQRRKLNGLDIPVAQKLDLTVSDAQDAELRRLAEELAGGVPSEPVPVEDVYPT